MAFPISVPSAKQFIENPPNPRRTIEALREMGYDSYASVMDLIDNSIDAQAKRIQVGVVEEEGDIVITIADDGIGMDEDTLSEALRLGSDTGREQADLGKFGMGLVTASIGLSRCVEVVSREEGGPVHAGGFDLDEIAEQDRFVKWVGKAQGLEAESHVGPKGTFVRLTKTDRISNRNPREFTNILRKRIGQVYRKFLKAGPLKITVNGVAVESIDPLMLHDPNTKIVLEAEIEIGESGKATLRVVDLPDFGQAGNKVNGIIPQNSGFYVLRNNREIQEAVTFEFYKKHPDYSHFRAEVCFDGSLDVTFHTDIKKTSINPPQGFMDRLRQATMALISESGRQGRLRANVERGEIDHSMAEANIMRRSKLIPKPKALLERRAIPKKKGSHAKGDGERSRTPHITDLKTISGLSVVFNEGNYGEQSPFYLVKQEGRTIVVTYNKEHAFWRELVEHANDAKVVATLDYLVFALANAELLVPEQAAIVKSNVNSTLIGLLV